jgi:two-component system response regulator FixJ
VAEGRDHGAPTVHIVDDDEAVRDSLSILLETHGIDVKTYDSCNSFLLARPAAANSCLVLDLHLPTMSGLDLLDQYPPKQLGMPVILISGRMDPQSKARALAAGAVAVVEKPFDGQRLLAAIGQAIASPSSIV